MARDIAGKKDLPFLDCLRIVSKERFRLGSGIPSKYQKAPWRVPFSRHNPKLNELLDRSFKVQMGAMPGTEFYSNLVSHACIVVTGLMHGYLKHLGIESELVNGCLVDKYCTVFHTWLEVSGATVETAFAFPEDGAENQVFKCKSSCKYLKNHVPDKTERLTDYEEGFGLSTDARKMLSTFNVPQNFEKNIVYVMSQYRLVSPGLKMYDFIMREHLKKISGSYPEDLEAKWAN
jgi:hypothetical protein